MVINCTSDGNNINEEGDGEGGREGGKERGNTQVYSAQGTVMPECLVSV